MQNNFAVKDIHIDVDATHQDDWVSIYISNYDVNARDEKLFIDINGIEYECPVEHKDLFDVLKILKNGTSQASGDIIYTFSKEDYEIFDARFATLLKEYTTYRVAGQGSKSSQNKMKPDCYIYMSCENSKRILASCIVCYGSEKYDLFDPKFLGQRNVPFENQLKDQLSKFFNLEKIIENRVSNKESSDDIATIFAQTRWACSLSLNKYEKVIALIDGGLDELRKQAELYTDETLHKALLAKTFPMQFGLRMQSNLLQLEVQITAEDFEEYAKMLEAYEQKDRRFYLLKTKDLVQFVDLEKYASEFKTLKAIKEAIGLKNLKNGLNQIDMKKARLLLGCLGEDADAVQIDESFKKAIDMSEPNNLCLTEKLKGMLKSYQKIGFEWLTNLYHYGLGGILADEMGIGKTAEFISLMEAVKMQDSSKNCLIICPKTLLSNWKSEIEKFATNPKIQIIAGSKDDRQLAIAKLERYTYNITSCSSVANDLEFYEGHEFDIIAVDEAQKIKNISTQVTCAVKSLKGHVKFALTGTPIENKLSDLWSLFDFALPGYLLKYNDFQKVFETPICAGIQEKKDQLHRVIKPFMLGRKKADVLSDLKEKEEIDQMIDMGGEQKKLYNAAAQILVSKLKGMGTKEYNKNRVEILSEITKLRQICCSPQLIKQDIASGKLEHFVDLLESLTANGHKVLVFSQFTSFLKMAQDAWEAEDADHKLNDYYFDGKDKRIERTRMVEEFQSGKGNVFFISLKAGGFGITLTEADTVIHLDPWWNKEVMNQASDRAHRIGQKRNVTIYNLFCKGTIEENILALQKKKKNLADSVISKIDSENLKITKEDLIHLLGERAC